MRRAVVATLVTAPLLAVPLASAAQARPAPPARKPAPPALTVAPGWVFRVGEQVDRAAPTRANIYDLTVFHRQVPVAVTWSATSRAGIDHYDLYSYRSAADLPNPHPVLLHTRLTSYATTATDVHGAIGPINQTLTRYYEVVATDRLGQSTVSTGNRRLPVSYEQENGRSNADASGGPVFGTPVHGPGWRTVAGPQFDGGTVLSTTARGSWVRLPVTAHHTQEVALEMTTGPRSGAVEVRIDGRRVGVVDTWSRTARPRVLVAQYRLEAGAHTVTLVNLGVRYRPTVQLDGVFLSD